MIFHFLLLPTHQHTKRAIDELAAITALHTADATHVFAPRGQLPPPSSLAEVRKQWRLRARDPQHAAMAADLINVRPDSMHSLVVVFLPVVSSVNFLGLSV